MNAGTIDHRALTKLLVWFGTFLKMHGLNNIFKSVFHSTPTLTPRCWTVFGIYYVTKPQGKVKILLKTPSDFLGLEETSIFCFVADLGGNSPRAAPVGLFWLADFAPAPGFLSGAKFLLSALFPWN